MSLNLYCTIEKFQELYCKDDLCDGLHSVYTYTCTECEYRYYTSIKVNCEQSLNEMNYDTKQINEVLVFNKLSFATKSKTNSIEMKYCPQCGNKLKKELAILNESTPSIDSNNTKRKYGMDCSSCSISLSSI
eukprot:762168_1